MKKTLNVVSNIFTKIWRIIDRLLLVPITKLILWFTSRFDKSGKKFEHWLSRSNTLLFLSLFLAVIFFISIDQKILNFTDSSAEVLKDQAVKVLYNEESYVVEGLPESVDITLIGRRSDIMFAKRSSARNVTIDLTNFKPGTYRVEINYHQELSSVDYKVNPSYATVVIYDKKSETKTLAVDLLNQDSLSDKLIIKNVNVDNDKVVIKGAEHQLKKVATVKALIDIKNFVKQEVGKTTLKDIPLRAYDEKGNVVEVEIVPSKINAEIEIASPSKEVPIKIIPKGDVSFGLAISSMTIDKNENKVTVYGDETVLANLNYIPVEIDVSGLKTNQQYKMELPKPVGIKSMSVGNITVQVALDQAIDREVENVNIEYRNLNDIYRVQGITEADTRISVTLKGVASVLDAITADKIVTYLDLSGYGEGEHEVDVHVSGEDTKVQYVAKTKKVKIRISKK